MAMRLDGLFGYVKPGGNLFGGEALGDELKYLPLSCRNRFVHDSRRTDSIYYN